MRHYLKCYQYWFPHRWPGRSWSSASPVPVSVACSPPVPVSAVGSAGGYTLPPEIHRTVQVYLDTTPCVHNVCSTVPASSAGSVGEYTLLSEIHNTVQVYLDITTMGRRSSVSPVYVSLWALLFLLHLKAILENTLCCLTHHTIQVYLDT